MSAYGSYGPRDDGFILVAELDLTDGYDAYSWAIVDVYRELSSGKLWAWEGSGCSCYGPHEASAFPTDYVEVRQLADALDLIPHVESPTEPPSLTKRLDFARKVREALETQLKGVTDAVN